MPAKSKAQRRASALALAAKRGEIPVKQLNGAAKQMYESMSMTELKKFTETKEKGLPKRKMRPKKAARSKKR